MYPDLDNKFPAQVDVIEKFIDPAIEDMQAINQYISYMETNNLIAAEAILETNPRLSRMIINADNLNKFVDGLVSVQRFFFDEVQQYLMNIVKYKGEWSASLRYTKYDVVYYANNSAYEAYMGITNTIPIGTLPTDLNYFIPMTIRGEQGVSGTGMAPRGFWSSVIQYRKDDCVSYDNILWCATVDNVGKTPQNDGNDWIAVLRVPRQVVFAPTQPEGQYQGDLWFKNLNDGSIDIYLKDGYDTYSKILPNANTAQIAETCTGNAATATTATTATTAKTCTGNAATATQLQTARTINGVSFNGSKNITITAAPNAHNQAAGTITAGTLPVGVVATSSTDYSTPRLRNCHFATTAPTKLSNGAICFVYE